MSWSHERASRLGYGDMRFADRFENVADLLLAVSADVCRYLLPNGKQTGQEWVCGDIHGMPGKSLSVNLQKGVWKDFSGGPGGADLINLWAAVHCISQGEAKREAEAWLGLPASQNIVPFPGQHRPHVTVGCHLDPQAGFESDWNPVDDQDPLWYRSADAKCTQIWDYLSIDGELVAQVYRFKHPVTGQKAVRPWNPKTLQWEAPKLDEFEKRPLLYLAEILEAKASRPVVIVEGEKTADAVREAGWSATTNMGGAQAVGLTDWSPLTGRHVIIWRDKDKAGRQHEARLVGVLRAAGVASCRVVKPPLDKPTKWDAADASVEERRDLLEAALASDPVVLAQADYQPADGISSIDWQNLDGKTPPEREFIISDWLPVGCATSLYGTGGIGKSFLAQLLGACVVGGKAFLGLPTLHCPVLALFCEDDDDELWRRQARINRMAGLHMIDLTAFAVQGRLGLSNLLMTFPKGKPPEFQPLLNWIEDKACEVNARLLILDNVAQMYGGEENSRAEVTAFINAANGMARRLNAAVLLLGHPPKSGAEYSGSTAWHAAVRCLWTLQPAPEREDDRQGAGTLILARFKANYSPAGEQIRLRWVDDVLCRDDGQTGTSALDRMARTREAKAVFLTALDALSRQQRSTSHSSHAPNYAPKLIAKAGLSAGFSLKELDNAMQELFNESVVRGQQRLWKGPDRKWVSGIARVSDDRGEAPEIDDAAPVSQGTGSRT